MTEHIAFLGAGLMGAPLIGHYAKAGYIVHAYNRTKSKLSPIKTQYPSIIIEDSPQNAIKNSNKNVFVLLFGYESVKNVLNDSKEELKGKVIFQMSTVSVQESLELQKFTIEHGGEYIETPLVGTNTVAIAGKLKILIGGTEQQFQYLTPYISPIGTAIYIGVVGKAAAFKLCFNSLVVSLTACFATSLALAEQHGLNLKLFLEFLKGTDFYFKYMDLKFPRFEQHNYEDANFTVPIALKDAKLIEQDAVNVGVHAELLHSIVEILEQTLNTVPNAENIDFSVFYEVLKSKFT